MTSPICPLADPREALLLARIAANAQLVSFDAEHVNETKRPQCQHVREWLALNARLDRYRAFRDCPAGRFRRLHLLEVRRHLREVKEEFIEIERAYEEAWEWGDWMGQSAGGAN
jgi:hypothetical protein